MNTTTHTQQIIKDAIEGGYDSATVDKDDGWYDIYPTLLDPLFWQAVGRTRGWKTVDPLQGKEYKRLHPDGTVTIELNEAASDWKIAMLQFIDHLAEGDDYETALSKL